jgi:carboxylesterase type B
LITENFNEKVGNRVKTPRLTVSIGVEHTDDLNYIIYRSDTTPEYNETDNEHKMVESMTRIWENFAYNRYSEKCLMI